MSPLKIKMLLDLYGGQIDQATLAPNVYMEAMDQLLDDGLAERHEDRGGIIVPTERGNVYVKAILKAIECVPLPTWRIAWDEFEDKVAEKRNDTPTA